VSFLRIIDAITNGTVIEINDTGTQVCIKPGIITLNQYTDLQEQLIALDCHPSRSLGWYVQGLLPLLPFGAVDARLLLRGVTDGLENLDPSVDHLSASALPLLHKFMVGGEEGDGNALATEDYPPPSLKVVTRGSHPTGGGSVALHVPRVKFLRPATLLDPGLIRRVRGVCSSTRVAPTSARRAAHAAKGVLHRLLPDVWIGVDARGGKDGGLSPGMKCCLVAESTTGVNLVAESCAEAGGGGDGRVNPEDMGTSAACNLLSEVERGGCVAASDQPLILLLMCLTTEDVSSVRVGPLTKQAVAGLRLFRDAFGVEMKVVGEREGEDGAGTVVLSCLGTGFTNTSRAVS